MIQYMVTYDMYAMLIFETDLFLITGSKTNTKVQHQQNY